MPPLPQLAGNGDFSFRDAFQCSNDFNPIRPVVGGELLERFPERNGDFFRWDIRLGREFPLLSDERLGLRFTFELFNVTNADNFFTDASAVRNAVLFNVDGEGNRIPNPNFMPLDQTPGAIAAQFGLKLIF